MAKKDTPERKLVRFFRERLRRIKICNCDIESKIGEDEGKCREALNKGKISKADLAKASQHIEFAVAQTFRYAMLVAVCSFVEEALVRIAKHADEDYGGHIKEIHLWENRAKAHLDLLRDHCGLNYDPIESQCERFHKMIILRNCVVHAWGNVAEDTRRRKVEKAVRKLDKWGQEKTFCLAKILDDDYLYIGGDMITTAILKAEEIVGYVCESVLEEKIPPWCPLYADP